MNKEELIKGIDLTIEGLSAIRNSISESAENTTSKTCGKANKSKETTAVEKSEAGEVTSGGFDVEELKGMKYNDFKKFASSLGVKCTGTRDEIMERILALENGAISEAETEETEAKESEAGNSKVVPISKASKKATAKKEEDEFDVQAKAIAEDTDVEDIIEALADVNIKATKKNCVSKLADALRQGLIELEDEDEDEINSDLEEAVDETEDDELEINGESYFSEFDPDGYNDPANMTDERAEAVTSLVEETLSNIESGELTEDDIVDYLQDACTDDEKDLLPDDYTEEQLIGFYLEMLKRNVDDDGEVHEPSDPYELNGEDLCCGHVLKYAKKTGKFICEICGTEYEAE